MVIALLDVNVLLALALPNHVHHSAAHRWFEHQQQRGWATCILTQSSFVRLYCNPAVTQSVRSTREALSLLKAAIAHAHHTYWQLEADMLELTAEITARMLGHRQVMDAVLLDLAIRKGGRLATFDKRLLSLLPAESPMRQSVDLVPVLD